MESNESSQSLVSSGSMSGSWVGRPSWMTVGIVPLRLVSVPEVGVISSVTLSSLHSLPRGEIYPPVRPRSGHDQGTVVDTGCAAGGTPVDYSPLLASRHRVAHELIGGVR